MMRGTGRSFGRVVALLSVVALGIAACSSGGDGKREATATTAEEATTAPVADRGNVDGELDLGYLLPSTGDLSSFGPPMIQAVKMAVRDVNAAGGVRGRPVTLAEADDGNNEDVAGASVARLLNTDRVDAVIGAASARITLSVIDEITGAGAVECSPLNTGSSLTSYPDRGRYFRTAPPDALQAQALAQLATADGHHAVGIVVPDDEDGRAYATSLKKALTTRGADVVADVAYDPSGPGADADVAELAQAKPQAVVLVAFPETVGPVLKGMIEKGVGPRDVAVYVTDGLQTKTLFEKVDPANPAVTQGVKGTAPAAAPAGGAAFFPPAFAQFAPGVPPVFSAHAYDCAIVIALAAQAAGSDDPGAFAGKMNEVTRGGTKCSTFADCKALLEKGDDIDYDGASGPLDFVKEGEPGAGSYDVYQFQADGTFAVLQQVQVG